MQKPPEQASPTYSPWYEFFRQIRSLAAEIDRLESEAIDTSTEAE